MNSKRQFSDRIVMATKIFVIQIRTDKTESHKHNSTSHEKQFDYFFHKVIIEMHMRIQTCDINCMYNNFLKCMCDVHKMRPACFNCVIS